MKRRILTYIFALGLVVSMVIPALFFTTAPAQAADTSVTYAWKNSTEIDASGSVQSGQNNSSSVSFTAQGAGTSGGENYQSTFWYKTDRCYVRANLINVKLGDTNATVQVTQKDVAVTAYVTPPACSLKQVQNAFNGTVQLANAGAVKQQPPASNKSITVDYFLSNSPYNLTCNSQGTGDASQVTPQTLSITLTGPNGYNKTQTAKVSLDCTDANSNGTNAPPVWESNFSGLAAGSYNACVQGAGVSKTCQGGTLTSQDSSTGITFNPPKLPGSGNTGAGGDPTANCEASSGGFGWLLCKVGFYLGDAEQSIEGYVDSLLKTQPLNFSCIQGGPNCTSANNSFTAKIYGVWSNFRIYGNIVLVIALLVIVFGEVVGGGVIDAYTAKKVLPRILVAAILINLSIYFVAIMEDIVNVIGGGIQTFIETPFKLTVNSDQLFSIHIGGGTGAIGLLALITATTYGVLAPGAVIFAVTVIGLGLLAALAVLITLMLRQVVIVLLIMFAPVAFALYCLPNTEQYFKKWWDLLIKTLMVYPIVSIMFAASQIAGVVLSNFNITATGNIIAQIIAFLAMIIPLFLIPFAFRMSGGLVGQVAGAVSNLRKTASSPLTNMYKKRAADRINKIRNNGGIYDKNTRRGRFGNKVTGWMFDADEKIPYNLRNTPVIGAPFRGAGRNLEQKITGTQVDQTAKMQEEMNNKWHFNDKAYRALTGAHFGFDDSDSSRDERGLTTQDRIRAAGLWGKTGDQMTYDEMLKMADALSFGTDTEQNGARQLRAAAGRLTELRRDPEMGYANLQGAGLMGMASHGFADDKDLGYVTQSLVGSTSEILATNLGARAALMGQRTHPTNKNTYGLLKDEKGYYGAFDAETDSAGNVQYETDTAGNVRYETNFEGKMLDKNGQVTENVNDAVKLAKWRNKKGRMYDLVRSIKEPDWAGAKAGSIREARRAIRELALDRDPSTGQLSDRAKSMRQVIANNAGQYNHADPDSTVQWRILAEQAGVPYHASEIGSDVEPRSPTDPRAPRPEAMPEELHAEAAHEAGHDEGGFGAPPPPASPF